MEQFSMHSTQTIFYRMGWEQTALLALPGRSYQWSGWSLLAGLHLQCPVANPWWAACGRTLPGSGWPSQCKSVENKEGISEVGWGKRGPINAEDKCWIQREGYSGSHSSWRSHSSKGNSCAMFLKQLSPTYLSFQRGMIHSFKIKDQSFVTRQNSLLWWLLRKSALQISLVSLSLFLLWENNPTCPSKRKPPELTGKGTVDL